MRALLIGVLASVLMLQFVTIVSSDVLAQTEDFLTVNKQALKHYRSGEYKKAAEAGERALALGEGKFGKDHPEVAALLNNLATFYDSLGRYSETEPIYKRSLRIFEKAFGSENKNFVRTLSNLAELYVQLGRYEEAEKLYNRSLSIGKGILEPEHSIILSTLNNLALLYQAQARFAEAEPILKRTLAIRLRTLGEEHRDVVTSLNNLGLNYHNSARYEEAKPLFERALEIVEKTYGPENAETGNALNSLAAVYQRLERMEEAEQLFKRSLAIAERALGPSHPDVGNRVNNLATLYSEQDRYREAAKLFKRAISIEEKILGSDHPGVALMLNNLAAAYAGDKQFVEASRLYQRTLAIKKRAFGPEHPAVARTMKDIGLMSGQQGRYAEAIVKLREAAGIYAKRGAIAAGNAKTEKERDRINVFPTLVWAAYGLAGQKPEQKQSLAEEALIAAQRGSETSSGAALSQMAARFGAQEGDLPRLIREQQDLVSQWRDLDKRLVQAFGQHSGKRDGNAIEQVQAKLGATETAIAALNAKLEKAFPEYSELASPQPLNAGRIRELLGPDEVLVVYLVKKHERFVWAVTADSIVWKKIGPKTSELEKQIATLRQSLDPIAAMQSGNRGLTREKICRGLAREKKSCDAYDTDLARAHRLYRSLLGPVAEAIEGKRHLIIVPSGPLTGLPFHMLLSAPPPNSGHLEDQLKEAKWLIRTHAVSVLPTVPSLRALRTLSRKGRAKRPFIGFGDPTFRKPSDKTQGRKKTRKIETVSEYTRYFRGKLADVDRLAEAIPPLPDTADELRAVGKALKARKSDIVLGRRASEARIKELSESGQLDDFRIVHFATHGLIAGEIKGLGEPALALSLPNAATERDDGLLMASEVAQLKLDADWVVLSACNTASGEKPGAEAFSGLARSFFYSGARSLLVSHWPVVSEAAVKLTTGAFDQLTTNPKIGRAEALRRSMLALIDNGKTYQRHPSYWAPFVVVGEAGREEDAGQSLVTPRQKTTTPPAKDVAVLAPSTAKEIRVPDVPALHDCDRLGASIHDVLRVGKGVVPGEMSGRKARKACMAAVRKYPDITRFQLQLGNALYNLNRFEEAAEWYRKAAGNDHPTAIAEYGALHTNGHGVPKNDAKAVTLFEKSVKLGSPLGMANLGAMYVNGLGVPKDYDKAKDLFLRASKEGSGYAYYWLGRLYQEGWGVQKDYQQARQWFEKAVQSGDPDGAAEIGLLYENGQGVPKKPKEAMQWYLSAAGKGSPMGNYYAAVYYDNGEFIPYDAGRVAAHLLKAAHLGDNSALNELRSGMENWRQDSRKAIQRQLKKAGTYRGSIDGQIGKGSRRALDAYLRLE